MQQSFEQAKPVLDAVNVAAVIALVAGWLPPLAALVTIVWTSIRIYESRTVQGLLARRRRAARK